PNNRPPIKDERRALLSRWTIFAGSGNPLTVIAAGNVHVRAIRESAFAGRSPNSVTRTNGNALCDSVLSRHMQVEDRPSGAFVSIAVEIEDHRSLIGSRDHAGRNCRREILGNVTC